MKIDTIVRSRRRTLSLMVNNKGEVIARAPLALKEEAIIDFARKKKRWIQKRKALVKVRRDSLKTKRFVDGEEFLYLGSGYKLKAVDHEMIRLSDALEFPSSLLWSASGVLLNWYRQQASRVIMERAAYYSGLMGVFSRPLRITNAKTRWGSCGRNNTLNFTWRLVMAPLSVVDYVVVHELAHIKEKNHSLRFWKMVEEYFPQYRKEKTWLRNNGYRLMAEAYD